MSLQGHVDEDLKFIAEIHEQVQKLYDAYEAGRTSVSSELAKALTQIRQELLGIQLDGSVDPTAADQRSAACGQIVEMLPTVPPVPPADPAPPVAPAPAADPVPPTAPVSAPSGEGDAGPVAVSSPSNEPLSDDPSDLPDPWIPLEPISAPASRRRARMAAAVAVLVVAGVTAGVLYFSNRPHHTKPATVRSAAPPATVPVPASTPGPFPGLSATEILQKTLAAAKQAGSAHVAVTIFASGRTMTAQADLGSNAGSETVVAGSDHADTIIVGGRFYLRANFGFLTDEMGIRSPTATKYANKWLSAPQPSGGQVGLTDSTLLILLDITNPTIGTQNPTSTVALNGALPSAAQKVDNPAGAPATLDVSTSYPFYPSSLTYSDQQGDRYQYAFSRWGEKTSFVAPANAVALP